METIDSKLDLKIESASIAELQAAMRTGKLTAVQLVDFYLDRVARFDTAGPALNSIVTLASDARDQAAERDAQRTSNPDGVGPLHGIPILVKDCLETADMPTSFGSEVFADYQPSEDATVIRKLREAGAIILGKTTLPDWATSWFTYSSRSGLTKNPYDLSRDPGGSSAGTGASIAAALATIGLGTDCGGSVRVPSSFCNLVGVRSTPGLISRKGCNPLVSVQDTIGPMGRSVADVARVFDVITGFDPDDELTYAAEIAPTQESYLSALVPDAIVGARIGVVRNAFGSDDDKYAAPVNEVMRIALEQLTAAGAILVDVEIPDLQDWNARTSMYTIKSKYDIDKFLAAMPDAPMHSVAEIIESKRYHPKLDLLEALSEGPDDPFSDLSFYAAYLAREAYMKTVVNLMGANDLLALVYPTVQVVPPTREECDSSQWNTLNFPTNTLIGSQTWMPSMTIPAGLTETGLPVGMEILARPYDERTLFQVGYGFEQVASHRHLPDSVAH
ncbi:amidase [Arthrobacter sp. L77]|uniref:amidase n=1 Tax=Arthrobacter sp. L77 TaxID=1496689 RepID=UPI0009E2717B|nr:amidase [Arthrobacter sp. L77]